MTSGHNTATTPSQTVTTSHPPSTTILAVTATPASPAITRSLDLEFEAEAPLGFQGTPAVSYGSLSEHPLSYTSWQLRQVASTAATSTVSAPVSITNAQTIRHNTRPMITSATPGNATQQMNMAQYYQPPLTYSMPPLYSAAFTAALSTPPHQLVVMPTGVMNSPITPGNQSYFPGYYYSPPYSLAPILIACIMHEFGLQEDSFTKDEILYENTS
ncbi:hypothetical protein HanHA89_Chr05g0197341 [Helianthus annuus]|nr:hypothetical protein HanHA89_Chr05g0197341 [Helianthus annuus]